MKVVCVIRTESMTNYTLGESYDCIKTDISWETKMMIKDNNGIEQIWSQYDIGRYFKTLRDYNLNYLVDEN